MTGKSFRSRDASAALSPRWAPTVRPPRWLRIMAAFARQGMHRKLAYRTYYWMQLVNTVVKILALATVWVVLYETSPQSFPVSRDGMISYTVMAGVSAEFLTWWDGPHMYIAHRLRMGTLTGDLIRPISFPFQMFALWVGESAAVMVTITLPAMLLATAVFGVAGPASPSAGALFVVSFALSFALLFCLNFLLGLLVMVTLSVKGLLVTYHGFITLLSGFWVPLWFYPPWLRTIADWLPFRQLFYTPLSLYVGLDTGVAGYRVLLTQVLWLLAAVAAVTLGWRLMRRRLVIQGG